MFGVVTRNAEELDWPEFDIGFYEVKAVSGRTVEPVSNAVNMVSCFSDNATAAASPAHVPVTVDGDRATRDRPYFDWSYICPTRERYRSGLLEIIEAAGAARGDVRLDDVGFPRAEYCHCDSCNSTFERSEFQNRQEWRSDVITGFVADAAERIPGRVYLTLHPDPYPGHLFSRSGIDVAAIEPHVDEFVVPLYDMAYSTTYWIEVIASGFQSLLELPFSIELYAVNVDIDNLIHAAEVAQAYSSSVLFGYDAGAARGVVRRIRASAREGETHGDSPDR